ncbi:MAG: acyltransferase domain-containing protein [Chloroflexi bacterium]|nr:acyltransferase domain-containing protein [Chloroflexota bacterium]
MNPISANDIAIISVHGRFPGAVDATTFWENLRDGVESITTFSNAALQALGVPSDRIQNPNFVKKSPILSHIDQFDARFFGYSPREAKLLDPQQRLFLECAWEALELAGYDPEQYPGLIGVFAGMGLSTYLLFNLIGHPDISDQENFQVMLGNDKNFLSTRVAYHLNLKGPSLDVQTGCSTSLVAAHLACDSLLSYQCDLALVGGITLAMPQRAGYVYQPGGIESPDGHCRPFDAQGKGTIFGSGAGVVTLKRMADALQDGDTIHAVIKGSAINNDGSAKLGYTAPSVGGQSDVILRAQRVADIEPDTIQYIETHGTATELGDPIEVEALTQAFRINTEKTQFCALGSVKSNMGHLDAAAGVTGLIKTALSLKHGQMPPSLHFSQPNPRIEFANSPFFVNKALRPFERKPGVPLRAGVSSFGIGGTNAHLILEEAPPVTPPSPSRDYQLLLLSGMTETAVSQQAINLANHLEKHPHIPLADVAHTLQVGRQRFPWRQAVACTDVADAIATLRADDPEDIQRRTDEMKTRPVVFMFSGQGSQYVQMGRGLYESESVFREQVDRCTELLRPHIGLDLRTILYPTNTDEATAQEQLRQTAVTQPALFTIEYALAQLWQSWGIHPQAMIGHSIGEFVAACLAGVLSLEDALTLVAARGRLMQALPGGTMLAVPLAETAVTPYLIPTVSLAVLNTADACVLSGPDDAIEAVQAKLAANGHLCRRLHTSHAFHSAMMDGALADFRTVVADITLHSPQISLISNVTGTWMTAEQAVSPDYWVNHLRQTVRFGDGIATLLQDPQAVLLEVGPGKALTTLARRQFRKDTAQAAFASLRHPKEPQADLAFLLTTVGQMWLTGVVVDWPAFYAQESRKRIQLPTYPFERQRYWLDPPRGIQTRSTAKKPRVDDWFYTPSWSRTMPFPLPPSPAAEQWLLFTDASGMETHTLGGAEGVVQQHLHQLGQTVTIVRAGEQFQVMDQHTITINPHDPADYGRLLQHTGSVQKIVHLWSVTAVDDTSCFFSLLHLTQALEKTGNIDPVRLGIVTTGLANVSGTDCIAPDKALLLGAARVIPQEVAHIRCQVFDMVEGASPAGWLAELWHDATTEIPETVIAFRGRYRWVERYEPTTLTTPPATPSLLRPHGVYLITGGLGGLGLTSAAYLAQTVQARLILLGHSPFPARETWDSVTDEKIRRQIEAVCQLEALGAEVLLLQADVADGLAMETAVSTTLAHFGELHGVFHAAGVPGGGLIQLKTAAAAHEIMAPKVAGLKQLRQQLSSVPLDFMLLYSSVTAVLGGIGQIDYSAANAYLDAVAQSDSLPFPVISVNWNEWQVVGMAATTNIPAEMQRWRQREIRQGILPAEGMQALARILHHPQPQVLVSTRDFGVMQAQSATQTLARMMAEMAQQPKVKLNRGGNGRSATYIPPQTDIEQTIANLWQHALDLEEQIGLHDNFFELGGNSLIGLQLVNRMNETLGLEISAVTLYESPTIHKLTQMIVANGQDNAQFDQRQGRGAKRRERLQRRRK